MAPLVLQRNPLPAYAESPDGLNWETAFRLAGDEPANRIRRQVSHQNLCAMSSRRIPPGGSGARAVDRHLHALVSPDGDLGAPGG